MLSNNFAVSSKSTVVGSWLASALALVLSKHKLHHVAIWIPSPVGWRSLSSGCMTQFPSSQRITVCGYDYVIGLQRLREDIPDGGGDVCECRLCGPPGQGCQIACFPMARVITAHS